jgi:hypothetical protein
VFTATRYAMAGIFAVYPFFELQQFKSETASLKAFKTEIAPNKERQNRNAPN